MKTPWLNGVFFHKYTMAIDLSKFPWLCSTTGYLTNNYSCTNDKTGSMVTESEGSLIESLTDDAYGKYGLKLTYYKVSENLIRDKIFGSDQLQKIERAFNVIMYTNTIPPNVRTYQIQGIWGEDVLTCYMGKNAFKYWSTYGGEDRNTPQVYEYFEPRIGDIVYLEANDTFYEVRDVKYFQEAFGLMSHTYTITLRVYKDTKLTINGENPTIKDKTDPIWNVATWSLEDQYNTTDILKQNYIFDDDNLIESTNNNTKDVMWDPYLYNEKKLDEVSNEFKELKKELELDTLRTELEDRKFGVELDKEYRKEKEGYKKLEEELINVKEQINTIEKQMPEVDNCEFIVKKKPKARKKR